MNEIYIKKDDLNEWIAKRFNGDLISIDNLLSELEDLIFENERLEEEVEDLREELRNNTSDDPYSYYGVSRKDFY